MLSVDYLIDKLKQILPISKTDIYDEQLKILTQASMSKLETEGVPNVFEEDTQVGFDYLMCVAYQVSKDMDFDIDRTSLDAQYITRVNTLRTKLLADKSGS